MASLAPEDLIEVSGEGTSRKDVAWPLYRFGDTPTRLAADEVGAQDASSAPSSEIHTVDFRSLYATILDGWLAADHATLLDGEYETLGIFT